MTAVPCPPGRRAQRPAWRRLFGAVLALSALMYLGWMVVKDFNSFWTTLRSQTAGALAAAMIAAIAMFAIKAIYHALLCERLSGKTNLMDHVIPAYAIAQVVRYLPGKVWGIVYQSGRLSQHLHPSVVVTANTSQTLMTNLLGSGIIGSVLAAAYLESPWPLGGVVFALVFTELLHRNPRVEAWLLGAVSRLLRRPVDVQRIPPQMFRGTLMLALEWAAYYFMWSAILGSAIPTWSTIVISTWYAAASLLAIFAVAVPAGIAVREALFVSLAAMTAGTQGELVGYAALMRLILTLAEIALIPVTMVADRIVRRGRGSAE